MPRPFVTVTLLPHATLAAVLVLTACGSEPPPRAAPPGAIIGVSPPARAESVPAAPPIPSIAPVERPRLAMGSTEGQAGADPELSTLDDAQLAAIVQAVLDGEIRTAQLAESQAATPEVKGFAHDTTTAYLDMQIRQNAIMQRLQVASSGESAPGARQKDAAQTKMTVLLRAPRSEFDHDYVDAEVRDQTADVDLLKRVVSSVHDPDFRTQLQAIENAVEGRLRMAQILQQRLAREATRRTPPRP
ncbi:MAG TPA: DUF4142 domain-containing protein [Polyangiaceae bacterium]|jgi:predicted outer membrane protein